MPRNEENGVSLGNGKVIEAVGDSLLVALEDYEDPILIPNSVIHADS